MSIGSLIVELEGHFEIRVPIETLELDSIRTIAMIQTLVESGSAEDRRNGDGHIPASPAEEHEHDTVVELKPGRRRPVFLIHDSYSSALARQPFALAIEIARPVLGIQARGLKLGSELDCTVEGMAAACIDAISAVETEGDNTIIGNSFGALVTHESAVRPW